VIAERDAHCSKQHSPSFSTDEGIQMVESDEQYMNAPAPIDKSREPDSNVMSERDVHCLKQRSPSVSTDEGIQMVESDEQCMNA
jgi:hypothetical protein